MNKKMYVYGDKLGSFFESISDVAEFNRVKRRRYLPLTIEEFVERAIKVHGDKYDYNKVIYLKNSVNVLIRCREHDMEFWQTPINHLYGSIGCSICNKNIRPRIIRKMFIKNVTEKKIRINSVGEKLIEYWLNKNSIKYQRQKTFDGCKNRRKLRYDFYLPNQNILIEYDGRQHFKPIECFGGENEFIITQLSDRIKTEYAINNGFKLFRIPYTERKNLSEMLKNNINI